MRAAGFWLIVAGLSAALLFLIAPVVLVIVAALDLAFSPLYGGPFWLIPVGLFSLPLVAVVLIFRGTFRSLRGHS